MVYSEKKLENGINVRICQMPNTHSVTMLLHIRGGAACEPLACKGITHFVEHLSFRRCSGVSQTDFYNQIESTGGFLRGITDRDHVLFEMTVHPKYSGKATDIFRSLFEKNFWTHEDIRREREVVFRQLEDAQDYCCQTMISDFFDCSAAGEPISGTKKKLARLTRSQLETWKKELFCCANCEIVVVGNIDPDQIEYLQKKFSDLPKTVANPLPDITPKSFLKRQNCQDRLYTDEAEFVKIGLAFDIDTAKISFMQARFLQNMLCRGLLSPFTVRLREELGLLHEIQSDVEQFGFGGFMYFIFDVHKDQALLLMDEITGLFARQKKQLDRRAFDCVYAAFGDGMEKLLDDPRGFAYELAFDYAVTVPQSLIERNKSITYEQICLAAKELFSPKNLIISMNDIPKDQELMDSLYEKKEIFRKALGE